MVTSGVGSGSSTFAPITLNGLVSGLDTKTIIQELMAIKRAPVTALQTQVTTDQAQSQALGNINSQLSGLLTALGSFRDAAYLQSLSASVSPGGTTASVAVAAGSGAAAGSFTISVSQLATATRVGSPTAIGSAIDPTALLKQANVSLPVTAGTFTVNGVQLSVDPTVDTLNDVIQRIQAANAGTTASLVADGSGRNNILKLDNAAGLTLGSGADTSNFLSAMNLLASPGTTSRSSISALGVVQSGLKLSTEALATPLSSTTGTFTVNGVQISYDATQDSLSTVLGRINSSSAGVIATYDSGTDTVAVVSKSTGSSGIQLSDTTGNLLAAIGLGSATATLGKNAQFQINSGNGNVTYYNSSNTVTNALPGVTLNLLSNGGPADTVTIAQDVNTAVGRVQSLVSRFNSAVDLITSYTAVIPSGQSGILAGNTTIAGIAENLRALMANSISGVSSSYTTPSQIGLTFGAITSAPGSDLTLNQGAFTAALQANPNGVANLFAAFGAAASLDPGGNGGIASATGTPTVATRPGSYQVVTTVNGDGTANLSAVFTPSDGSAAFTTVASNVAPGSTNTTLIAGLTLTMRGSFTAGTDTLTVTTPVAGLATKLQQYLTPLNGSSGAVAAGQTSLSAQVKGINKQIDQLNTRLQAEQLQLQTKFAIMEQSLAQLKSEQQSLNSFFGTGTSSGSTL